MRALVTGGAGFVGTNLIKRLVEEGYDVTSFDNYSTGFRENQLVDCTYITWDNLSVYLNSGSLIVLPFCNTFTCSPDCTAIFASYITCL